MKQPPLLTKGNKFIDFYSIDEQFFLNDQFYFKILKIRIYWRPLLSRSNSVSL